MAGKFYLTEADRDESRFVSGRVRGMAGSRRPVPTRRRPAGSGSRQQVLKGTLTSATPGDGTAVMDVTPIARFDGVTPDPVRVLDNQPNTVRASGVTVHAIRGTRTVDAGSPAEAVDWVEIPTGEGGPHPHFTAVLDADLEPSQSNASLTGVATDYVWLDGEAIDPAPTSPANIFDLPGLAGDRVLIGPGRYPSWEADKSYATGEQFVETSPGDSQTHLYTVPASLTAGADPPGFDSTEEARYTDEGLHTVDGYVVAGVFRPAGEAGTEGKIAWLETTADAAEEKDWDDLTQAEKDDFPTAVQTNYDANGGRVLIPKSGTGELALTFEHPTLGRLNYRTFDENLDLFNTVQTDVGGGQFVQIKSYVPPDGSDNGTGIIDVSQCAPPVTSS